MYSHLHLGLLSSLFLSGFSTEILHELLFFALGATSYIYLNFLDYITRIMFRRKRHEARNFEFIQRPVTSFQLDQNVSHNTQVPNSLNP